jgi:hypothetical protein
MLSVAVVSLLVYPRMTAILSKELVSSGVTTPHRGLLEFSQPIHAIPALHSRSRACPRFHHSTEHLKLGVHSRHIQLPSVRLHFQHASRVE